MFDNSFGKCKIKVNSNWASQRKTKRYQKRTNQVKTIDDVCLLLLMGVVSDDQQQQQQQQIRRMEMNKQKTEAIRVIEAKRRTGV